MIMILTGMMIIDLERVRVVKVSKSSVISLLELRRVRNVWGVDMNVSYRVGRRGSLLRMFFVTHSPPLTHNPI